MRKILPFFSILFFFSCQNESPDSQSTYLRIVGQTMGTTYHITYEDIQQRNFKSEMDSILVEINQAVSTYIPDSRISLFNKNEYEEFYRHHENRHFEYVYFPSKTIFDLTDGYFDPTVMPLVNYWGFGYKEKRPVSKIDSLKVDSLNQHTDFKKISQSCDGSWETIMCSYEKKNPNIQLDFSAIAKGYAVDVLSEFFNKKNIQNYLVEVGGELRTKGKNPRGKLWTTAINTPRVNAKLTDYEAIITIDNKGIATSGNYRNFHEVNGEWYGHAINPKTGFPEKSNLLSVTVMAENCMKADAYATAFLVMGLEKSKALVEKLESLDAFFIFANETGGLETFYTKGFEGHVVN